MSGWRILGDWGSTRLRLWRLRGGAIDGQCDGPGIVGLKYPAMMALHEAIRPWLAQSGPCPIILCGMAGARDGLHEAGYVECPASITDWKQAAVSTELDGLPVWIAAGCAYRNSAEASDDVMRGEETQVFGALALTPELGQGRQTIVLPGTHSKWVIVESGRITSLRTFLTGELFALLQTSSLLGAAGAGTERDSEGFAAGLARAGSATGLLGSLFEARAAQLRRGRSSQWAQGFLSGLLIGSEIAGMRANGLALDRATIIGEPALTKRYRRAFAAAGVATAEMDGETCALAGLRLLDADD